MEIKNNTRILPAHSSADVDIKELEEHYSMILKCLSHEFANILTLINSSLQIIEPSHPEVRTFKYWNSTILDVNYMKDLLIELSSFNNCTKLNISKIDLNMLIVNILESFSLTPDYEKIKFSSDLPSSKTLIYLDYVKIKQTLVNLIKNACESIEEIGEICVSLYRHESYIVISISDNGCGICEELLKDIFTPSFTNKSDGCGLGLAISKRVISSHNGNLTVKSKKGEGSTFIITLPITQDNLHI